MRPHYILNGFGLLLCSSFFDSLRGPLLPLLSQELTLSYEQVSLFLVAGYLSAMVLGRALIPLIERFTLHRVTPVLCLMAPVTAVYCYRVQGLETLIGLGVLVACLSALVGSVANLFVLKGTDPIYRARFFGLLHAMYGLGSQIAPLSLGLVLAEGWEWRSLFVIGMFPVLALGTWIQFGLPAEKREVHTDVTRPRAFTWFSIQGMLVTAFAIYVAAEVGTSMWMVAYLVEVRHLTVAEATPYATGFFFVLTASRFGCFLVRRDQTESFLIVGGLCVGLAAFVIGLSGHSFFFPLAGLVGPYFPLVLARMSRYLPREAPSLTLRILIVAQGTLAACHFGLGYLATHFGVGFAYQVPAVAFFFAIACILFYLNAERRLPTAAAVC